MSKKTTKKVPELRFAKFLESWETTRIEKISNLVTSGSRGWAEYYSKNGSKFIRMTNLDRRNIKLLLNDLKYVSLPPNNSEAQRTALKPGDILISITAELGKIGIVDADLGEAYINQHICLVRPYPKTKISPLFLAIYLSTYDSFKRLNRLNDSGAKAGLNLGSIKKFKVQIPTIPEQEKIASFLGAVDARLGQLRRKHELLKTYKRGVMQQLFSQQIRFKQDDGSPFPNWEKKKLGELLTIRYGKDHKDLEDGNYPVLGTGGVMRYVSSYLYDKPSILIGRKGTIDQPKFVTFPFWTVDTLFYSEIRPNVVPFLLFLVVQSVNWKKYNEATGVPSLSASSINNVKVVIPTKLEEQNKIADLLTVIDQKIELVQKKIERTEQFKKGLLQKMFV